MSREGGIYIRQGMGNPNRGGRKKVDLLFPFCDFVVDEVLDYLRSFRGKVPITALYSFPHLTVFYNIKPKPTEKK